MPKNYYIILGIPADSSDSDIKSAYRRLAKEYHPDYYGDSHSPFQAIQEAYSVLSDPSQRKQYDDNLSTLRVHRNRDRENKAQRNFYQADVEPLVPEQHQAEPLVPETSGMPQGMVPDVDSSINRFFNTASSSWDYDRGSRGYKDIEVFLTSEQAERGGHVRIHLPAQVPCPSCQGWATDGMRECWRCFGAGFLRGEIPLLVNYPPGITDNHVVQFPLSRYGYSGNPLKVRFKVADLAR